MSWDELGSYFTFVTTGFVAPVRKLIADSSISSVIASYSFMLVFLDDERPTPENWVRVYWPEQAIALLKSGLVEEISLDHDLGDDQHGTGYDVILWIEKAVAFDSFKPPKITIHSANPSARVRMRAGIASIERLVSAIESD